MKKHSLIRTIYLYLFALLGLVLLTIGGVRFIDMGLKAFVFTKAEEMQKLDYARPPDIYPIGKFESIQENSEKVELTESERTQLKQALQNYKSWEESRSKVDYVTANRHRDASINLALILVGLPLYFYHWFVIKKETKNNNNEVEVRVV